MLDEFLPISSKDDLVKLISALARDFKENPDEWENKDLSSYLEAVASWIEDMDGYYENTNQPLPKDTNWKVFADILMAAKVYE
ncbi:hypothetical protein ABRP70_05460 [Pectobacterium odoriferum]|uniref:DUF7660 domain-containing protein n=1 Tax=Pectobacterium odoriferum TaxID=78398 RepID=A0ABR4VI64_9GAMM|nr:hypothetical protein [Pectobacterium odoriferum]AIU90606.1 hypothetical protein BCS7_20970 [Pectobacterium odoriferum]KGA39055.1 hypothetical protein KU75_24935 [Pectobacterium odoriferum]MBA0189987.1 hypothetical protein [Pectobacterium odoriferum]POE05624.1 hypothetical protein BV921_23010 [Pectobacterium odoriferum]POE16634.1 hypothetical protein BV918_16275 [Pectobacterium odoriferum]